jgi:hypothetical protein
MRHNDDLNQLIDTSAATIISALFYSSAIRRILN